MFQSTTDIIKEPISNNIVQNQINCFIRNM